MEQDILKFPKKNTFGNLIWKQSRELVENIELMRQIQSLGYTVYPFPEEDGFAFAQTEPNENLSREQTVEILDDFLSVYGEDLLCVRPENFSVHPELN